MMSIKDRIHKTKDVLGGYLCVIPSAVVTQALAASGADWLVIGARRAFLIHRRFHNRSAFIDARLTLLHFDDTGRDIRTDPVVLSARRHQVTSGQTGRPRRPGSRGLFVASLVASEFEISAVGRPQSTSAIARNQHQPFSSPKR
jgi:hypothetical protein